ncbi:MAG: hypothetical protein OEW49_06505 [Nitrosopumilus sp.]|nr:hypothetical protein [Nitrosopumilus sp.]
MVNAVTLTGIFTVIVLIIALNQLPNGDVSDSKSAVKNAQKGLVTDTIVKVGEETMEVTGNQAIDSACRDGPSQSCSVTTNSVNMIGVVFSILIIGLIISAIIGAAKFMMNILESF